MAPFFFGVIEHATTVDVYNRRIVNSESHITVCLPESFQNICKTRLKGKMMLSWSYCWTNNIVFQAKDIINGSFVMALCRPDLARNDFILCPQIKDKL